jgi:hypothetical protein
MSLPSRDVQMVMLSPTGARPVSGVGDGSQGAVGKGQGVARGGALGKSGQRDAEFGMYGGGEGEAYDGYAVAMAVAVPVTQEDANRMIGASAPPLVEAVSK